MSFGSKTCRLVQNQTSLDRFTIKIVIKRISLYIKRPSLVFCLKSERSTASSNKPLFGFQRCLKSERSDFGIPLYVQKLYEYYKAKQSRLESRVKMHWVYNSKQLKILLFPSFYLYKYFSYFCGIWSLNKQRILNWYLLPMNHF